MEKTSEIAPELFWADYLENLRIPVRGLFHITGQCNLKCRHCFVKCRWNDPHVEKDIILRIAAETKRMGCLFGTLAGGEPLTHPEFLDIYMGLTEIGLQTIIVTNGTLVTPRVADMLKEMPPFKLKVSLYSIDDETFRRITNGSVSFAEFTRGLDLLNERDIPFIFTAMMLKTNKRTPEDVENFAARWNAPVEFNTSVTAGLDGSLHPLEYRLSPEEIHQYYDANTRNYNKLYYVPRRPRGNKWNKDGLHNCNCGRTSFFVDSRGFLHPCSLSHLKGIDIRKDSFASGWVEIQKRLPEWVAKTELHKKHAELTMCPPFVRLQGKNFDLDYHLAVSQLQNEREAAYAEMKPGSEEYRSITRKDKSFNLHSFLSHLSGFVTKCACSSDDSNPYQVA